jgi:hypothetical protein
VSSIDDPAGAGDPPPRGVVFRDVRGRCRPECRGVVVDLVRWLTPSEERECLHGYVARMLCEQGCDTSLRWARRYRVIRAHRITALKERLGRRGPQGRVLRLRSTRDFLYDEATIALAAVMKPCVWRRGPTCELTTAVDTKVIAGFNRSQVLVLSHATLGSSELVPLRRHVSRGLFDAEGVHTWQGRGTCLGNRVGVEDGNLRAARCRALLWGV